ncbi:MAG: type 4a pilus biogenesis protein PilO [Candidatus Aminicenantes bacterium]|nr:MAG: type 4a pilus biogenesis protein PilO [Candidatus Aminicenantes bacterium]
MKDWPWYGHIVLAAIIFGLIYMVYFKPKGAQLNRMKVERTNVQAEVNKLRLRRKELNQIEKDIKSLTGTLNELEAIIPQKKEISNILRRIQQLALDSRLAIRNFAPKGEVDMGFYAEWPIPIQITGSFHNLGRLFDRLSRFERLFNVERFSIKALRSQSEAQTISANFTAKTYIFREEVPAKKKKKPTRRR